MRDAVVPFIAGRSGARYVWRRMPRLLTFLLLALALLLSPLAMIGGAGPAYAAAPQAASAAGHCAETAPAPLHETPAPGLEVGCAVACAAVPATERFSAESLSDDAISPAMPGDQLLSGIHPEGETPPPRIRPEI